MPGEEGHSPPHSINPDNFVSDCLDTGRHPAQSYHISWLAATGAEPGEHGADTLVWKDKVPLAQTASLWYDGLDIAPALQLRCAGPYREEQVNLRAAAGNQARCSTAEPQPDIRVKLLSVSSKNHNLRLQGEGQAALLPET